jgi:hypothetical protein
MRLAAEKKALVCSVLADNEQSPDGFFDAALCGYATGIVQPRHIIPLQ